MTIAVGDVVRVSGETFDSIVRRVTPSGDLELAGWPNPIVSSSDVQLVRAYSPGSASAIQQACVAADAERRAAHERYLADRCPSCKGTGRRAESAG